MLPPRIERGIQMQGSCRADRAGCFQGPTKSSPDERFLACRLGGSLALPRPRPLARMAGSILPAVAGSLAGDSMAAVTLQDVVKTYAGQLVLNGVTLDLHKGEKVG